MARPLTDSSDFFGALSRAYALGGEHPPHHPAVRVALAEAMTTLHSSLDHEAAAALVSPDGLRVQGRTVGPPGDELGSALARAGVTRIAVADQTAPEALESLLRRIRLRADEPISAAELRDLEGTGLCLALSDEEPSGVPRSEPIHDDAAPATPGAGAPEQVRDDATAAHPGARAPEHTHVDTAPAAPGAGTSEPRPDALASADRPAEPDGAAHRLARSISALFLEAPAARPNGGNNLENGARPSSVGDGASLDDVARAYVDDPDPELAERLVEMSEAGTTDEDEDRLVAAIRALAGPTGLAGRDPRLVLARRLAGPTAQRRLIERLAGSSDPANHAELKRIAVGLGAGISDVLARAIADAEDPGVRRTLLETMVAVGAVGREPVQRMLDDDRWFVVRNGVRLLPDVAGRSAVEDLLAVTGHSEPRVRREVVTALARAATSAAAQALVGLVDDPDADVRAAAAAALGVVDVDDRASVLLRRLQVETDPDVQVALIRALASVRDESAVPELERRATRGLFAKRPRTMRLEALHALWSIGTPRARAVVMATLDDRDPEIKGAVRALLGGR